MIFFGRDSRVAALLKRQEKLGMAAPIRRHLPLRTFAPFELFSLIDKGDQKIDEQRGEDAWGAVVKIFAHPRKAPGHRGDESDGHHEEGEIFGGAFSEGVNDDKWPERAGQSGPSEDDEREDIGRREESDGE